MTKKLNVDEAEEKLGINYFGENQLKDPSETSTLIYSSPVRNPIPKKILPGNLFESIADQFEKLSSCQRLELLTKLFQDVASKDFSGDLKWFIPRDFVKLSLHGMQNLHMHGKSNTIYHLSKCVGELRPDSMTTRVPITWMPFGLISYNCEFFSSDDVTNLHASKDYMQWMETMYAHFGNKWACLHNGPMWPYEEDESAGDHSEEVSTGAEDAAYEEKEDQLENADSISVLGACERSDDLISQAMLSAFGADCFPSNESSSNTSTCSELVGENQNVSFIWSVASMTEVAEVSECREGSVAPKASDVCAASSKRLSL